MLLLSRYAGESIIIDDEIKITILNIDTRRGNQVKIGIDAPRSVTVDREEIHDRKQAEMNWSK